MIGSGRRKGTLIIQMDNSNIAWIGSYVNYTKSTTKLKRAPNHSSLFAADVGPVNESIFFMANLLSVFPTGTSTTGVNYVYGSKQCICNL